MGTHPIFESDFDCLTDTPTTWRITKAIQTCTSSPRNSHTTPTRTKCTTTMSNRILATPTLTLFMANRTISRHRHRFNRYHQTLFLNNRNSPLVRSLLTLLNMQAAEATTKPGWM